MWRWWFCHPGVFSGKKGKQINQVFFSQTACWQVFAYILKWHAFNSIYDPNICGVLPIHNIFYCERCLSSMDGMYFTSPMFCWSQAGEEKKNKQRTSFAVAALYPLCTTPLMGCP